MKTKLALIICSAITVLLLGAYNKSDSSSSSSPGQKQITIGVAFETLQTEGWVAGFEKLKSEGARENIKMLEAIADGDANRQLEQVKNFINRKVDDIIIIAPKDSKTVIPMIKAANAANIPGRPLQSSGGPNRRKARRYHGGQRHPHETDCGISLRMQAVSATFIG